MKVTNPILLVLVVFFALGTTSCGQVDKGKKFADNFFNLIIDENYDEAQKLLVSDNLGKPPITIRELKFFGDHFEKGKLLKAEKNFGFNSTTVNGTTTVKLPYELTYENITLSCEVVMRDHGNGFRIVSILF